MSYLSDPVFGPWQIFNIHGIRSFIQQTFIMGQVGTVLDSGGMVLNDANYNGSLIS